MLKPPPRPPILGEPGTNPPRDAVEEASWDGGRLIVATFRSFDYGVGTGGFPSVTTFLSDGAVEVTSLGLRRRMAVQAGEALLVRGQDAAHGDRRLSGGRSHSADISTVTECSGLSTGTSSTENRMTQTDPFSDFKQRHKEMWASFTPTAIFTTPVAAHLVKFAGIASGETVLDVATGTGVVAITAARTGARVTGLDLTPPLLDQARQNARIARVEEVVWTEGDAEALPYPDASFDVVVSQFGHMFAPRPEVAVPEMRRVLKPGGRVAFATWPPEHLVGRMFAFVGRNSPPPASGRGATAAVGESRRHHRTAGRRLRGALLRSRHDELSGAQRRALSAVHGDIRRSDSETGRRTGRRSSEAHRDPRRIRCPDGSLLRRQPYTQDYLLTRAKAR